MRPSAETLSRLLDISGIGCWEWDCPAGTISFDHHWASAMGYPAEDGIVEFTSWSDIIHPDDLVRVEASMEAMRSCESSGSVIEYRILTASGNFVWVLDRSVPGPVDDSGVVPWIFGYQVDINQDRLAEERLFFQRKLGAIISSSRSYREALAGTLEVLVGLPPFNDGAALAPDTETGMLDPMVQGTTGSMLMDTLAGYRSSEHPVCRASLGYPVYFSPMPDPAENNSIPACACVLPVEFNGEMIAVFLFTSTLEVEVPLETRDILWSISKWMGRALSMILNLQDLQGLYLQARKDSESREELLREVNHRVKNNLAAIVGLLYAERRFLNSEQEEIWRPVQQDLISRIQGLATVHSMLSATRWAPLPMSDLTYRILSSTLKAVPGTTEVTLSVSPSGVLLTSDQAHQFGMLINELATNTLKYVVPVRDRVKVVVDIEPIRDMIRLTYRDNGPGFPEDVLSLRKHNLGLELVRNILRSVLGGELTLRNDGGAVVELCFSRKRIEEDPHAG